MRIFRQRAETVTPIFSALILTILLFAGAVAVSSDAASARPLLPAERQYIPYRGVLPPCDDPAVFERIQSHFFQRESEFWKTGLAIDGFDRVREVGFRTNGLDYIPRRYCVARAHMNDAKLREVTYSIDEDLGIIGFGFEVEWCVRGLDRLNAFAPNCTMALP